MKEVRVQFTSEGTRISGFLRTPDGSGPYPGVVQGPGWLGLADAKLYLPYHEAFCNAGFAVFIFDYRGFGESGGDRNTLSPAMQLEDLVNAVTYLDSRDEISSIGAFGSGGTGGGNAIALAAADERIRCVISQVPVADGEDWLRRMRTESEWQKYLHRLDADKVQRKNTGKGEMVHPRTGIMIPTKERQATNIKKDVDNRIPNSVPLAAALDIMAYRPIDDVAKTGPLMIVTVENDETTPTDHATALYEAASEPKSLIMQTNTTHYAAYEKYGHIVRPKMVAWLRHYLAGGLQPPTGISTIGDR